MRLRRKPWVDKAIHDFDDFVFPKDAPASEEQQGRWAEVAAMELKNVRLLVFDIHEIERIFAPGEVDRFFLNFCDPWPKKRHYKRRLTYRGFLEKYRHLLKQGGELHFKTDNRPLFDFSLKEFEAAELPVRDVSYDLHAENRPDNIMTEYERKFSGFGEKINRCEVIFP